MRPGSIVTRRIRLIACLLLTCISLSAERKDRDISQPSPAAALRYTRLASLAKESGRFQDAELPRSARSKSGSRSGKEHPDVAAALNNLGEICRILERLPEAETNYRRALYIFEKNYGPAHTQVATVLNNMALLWMQWRNPAKALPLLRRAVAIWEGEFGDEDARTMQGLDNLGALEGRRGSRNGGRAAPARAGLEPENVRSG